VVILLIDKKCGDGNNKYYSENSHSKLPRYFNQWAIKKATGWGVLELSPDHLLAQFFRALANRWTSCKVVQARLSS
jgi:hypothetical protein